MSEIPVFDPGKTQRQWERDGTLVYHYTDFAGLKGIIETGELWLTDSRFQNDSKEIRSFMDTAGRMLMQRKDAPASEQDPLRQALSAGWEYWMFTSSFSKARSLLSQWRAYAPRGGVSIGFSRSHLSNTARQQDVEIADCIYEQSAKNKLIAECFEQALASANYIRWRNGEGDSSGAFTAVRKEILWYAARSKIHEYNEEREVRLFKHVERIDDGIELRMRGHRLVPYLRFKLDGNPTAPSTNRLGICEIVVWPGDDRDMTAVAMLASKHRLGALISNSLSAHRMD